MDRNLRRYIKPRELRDLYEAAADAGCTITQTRGGHMRITTPQGVVHGACTASDHRAVRNVRSQLRRNGVNLP